MSQNHFDSIWKNVPMPVGYTCGCGIYVHPSKKNPNAIHIKGCPYSPMNIEELKKSILSQLNEDERLAVIAENNDLEHFHYVGCGKVETLICDLIDIDDSEIMGWFNTYLNTPLPTKRKCDGMLFGRNARNNPLNIEISKLYWESKI